jgi:hypothetical protein
LTLCEEADVKKKGFSSHMIIKIPKSWSYALNSSFKNVNKGSISAFHPHLFLC